MKLDINYYVRYIGNKEVILANNPYKIVGKHCGIYFIASINPKTPDACINFPVVDKEIEITNITKKHAQAIKKEIIDTVAKKISNYADDWFAEKCIDGTSGTIYDLKVYIKERLSDNNYNKGR